VDGVIAALQYFLNLSPGDLAQIVRLPAGSWVKRSGIEHDVTALRGHFRSHNRGFELAQVAVVVIESLSHRIVQ
jgi:hypothetical protein